MKNKQLETMDIQLKSGETITVKQIHIDKRYGIEFYDGAMPLGAIFLKNKKESIDILQKSIGLLTGFKNKQWAVINIQGALRYLKPNEFLFTIKTSYGNKFTWNQINILSHQYGFLFCLRYDSLGNCLSDDERITILFPKKRFSIGSFRKIEGESEIALYEFDKNVYSYNNL